MAFEFDKHAITLNIHVEDDGDEVNVPLKWWIAMYIGVLGFICMIVAVPNSFFNFIKWVCTNNGDEGKET